MQAEAKNQMEAIGIIVSKHQKALSPTIPILQEIQSVFGYVSPEFLLRVSKLTDVPVAELYGVVTFYSQFRLAPLGKTHIQVCNGTACHLAGAEQIIHAIEHESKTTCGCTSEDGEFSVEKVACIGCCSLAPVISINSHIQGNLNADQVRKIILNLKKEKQKGGEADG